MKARTDVLLVEDRPEDAELAILAFEEHFKTKTLKWVKNGKTAIEFLKEAAAASDGTGSKLPKLVLLDLKMSGMDGLEVLKVIRSNQAIRNVPVVMLTTSEEVSDLESAFSLGANSYMVKPVDFKEFSDSIKKVGNYWLNLNQAPR